MTQTVWTLGQIQAMLEPLIGPVQRWGAADVPLARVHSDSRSVQSGDLFVALKGARFDAHDYLAQVAACGGCAVLAERGLGRPELAGLAGLLVPHSQTALMALAQAWRAACAIPLIAVVGSNGKTTVTHMLASILRAWQGAAAHATQGNLNNAIGLPLTLLGLRPQHRVAVVELGMNHPGEIAQLAAIAAPTVAVVNNAQHEHLEFMHSVAAVAAENGSVLAALPATGVAVFGHDDDYAPMWRALAGARRCVTFGSAPTSVTAQHAEVIGNGQWQADRWQITARLLTAQTQTTQTLTLAMAGAHNMRNALAACATAYAADVPWAAIAQGIAQFEPLAGRSRRLALPNGRCLIDDSYNANPDSVLAAIAMLASLPGPHLLVLGDMGEVGAAGPKLHREVVAAARATGIAHVLLHGELYRHAAQGGAVRHCERIEELIALAQELQNTVRSSLVKGSRFMRMERVVQALQAAPIGGVGVC